MDESWNCAGSTKQVKGCAVCNLMFGPDSPQFSEKREPITQLACVLVSMFCASSMEFINSTSTAYRNLNKVTRLPFSIGRSTLMPTSTWGTWYGSLSFSVRADSVQISMFTQYLDIGRHDDAVAAFKSAITLQRDHANSWNNLGLFYENMSK